MITEVITPECMSEICNLRADKLIDTLSIAGVRQPERVDKSHNKRPACRNNIRDIMSIADLYK